MTSFAARCIGALAIALATPACGSAKSSASDFEDPGNTADTGGAATDTSVTTDDTSPPGKKDTGGPIGEDVTTPPDTGTGPLTLDNVCARLAEAKCSAAFATCCSTAGAPPKDGVCRANALATCGEQVKDIKSGKGTFNPGEFAACAAAWNTVSTKCRLPVLELLKTMAPCFQLLNGAGGPGASCDSPGDCNVPAGAFGSCRDGRCESIAIVGADKMCVYAGSTRAICDYGQGCVFTSGASGTCKSARPLGSACNNSAECGFGNWCERSFTGASKCVEGRGAGATCTESAQCASGTCNAGKCSDPLVVPVSFETCNGG